MRLAVLLPAALLVALITGAMATTAGTLADPGELWKTWVFQHRIWARGADAVILVVLAWTALKQVPARKLSVWLIVGVLIESAVGEIPSAATGWGGVLHATLAALLVAGGIALAAMLAPSWAVESTKIQDYGWPSLRSLAVFTPVLVVLQVMLGAMFRHRILTLWPHIVGAMLVSLFLLMVAAFVQQQCKANATLLQWGRLLMVTTFVQIFLGLAAFGVRSVRTAGAGTILAIATTHIATGSLLLSASILLGMQIRRNVTPKAK